nr:uncharacterized protein LOC117272976 [Nicotiana tomentosiformis]
MTPSKKRRTTGASSSGHGGSSRARAPASASQFDHTRFVSRAAQDRFSLKATKKPVPKRGIGRASLQDECPNMYRELIRRRLDSFFEEPKEGNLMFVREFYANYPEYEDRICTVRHTRVDASIEAIRRVYRLPVFNGEEDFYDTYKREPITWNMFFRTICAPDKEVVWVVPGSKLHSASLTFEGKCWLYIINSRLLSSHNTTEVNGPRATLI